jgi:hypothetical protein
MFSWAGRCSRSIEGFSVEAQDGSIGKIDESTHDVGSSLRRRRHRTVDPWQEGSASGRHDRAR